MLAGGLDGAAVTSIRSRGIERTADIDRAAIRAAQELDLTTLLLQRSGFDDTGVVDYGIQQRVARGGCHYHRAAIGLNELPVLDEGPNGALIDLDVQQPVAAEVQCHGTTR